MTFGTVTTTDISTSSGGILVNNPSPQVAGHQWLMCLVKDSGGAITVTPPAGWTLIDTVITANSTFPKWMQLYKKISTGAEGASSSWDIVSNAAGGAIAASWSGRSGAITFETQTLNNSQNASPITLAAASGSALAGDDVAYFIEVAKSAQEDWTLGAPATFTNRVAVGTFNWVSTQLATKDNVGAGAIGTLAGTETVTGSGTGGWSTFVVSMTKAAAGSGFFGGFKKWILRTKFSGLFAGITGGGGGGTSTMTAGPWALPTFMEDGSAIGTITNQTVYYDTVSRMGTGIAYANSVSVGDGVTLSKVLTGLSAATTYYYATTVTVGGVESNLSGEVSGVSVP